MLLVFRRDSRQVSQIHSYCGNDVRVAPRCCGLQNESKRIRLTHVPLKSSAIANHC
jgi:hypothetical protein